MIDSPETHHQPTYHETFKTDREEFLRMLTEFMKDVPTTSADESRLSRNELYHLWDIFSKNRDREQSTHLIGYINTVLAIQTNLGQLQNQLKSNLPKSDYTSTIGYTLLSTLLLEPAYVQEFGELFIDTVTSVELGRRFIDLLSAHVPLAYYRALLQQKRDPEAILLTAELYDQTISLEENIQNASLYREHATNNHQKQKLSLYTLSTIVHHVKKHIPSYTLTDLLTGPLKALPHQINDGNIHDILDHEQLYNSPESREMTQRFLVELIEYCDPQEIQFFLRNGYGLEHIPLLKKFPFLFIQHLVGTLQRNAEKFNKVTQKIGCTDQLSQDQKIEWVMTACDLPAGYRRFLSAEKKNSIIDEDLLLEQLFSIHARMHTDPNASRRLSKILGVLKNADTIPLDQFGEQHQNAVLGKYITKPHVILLCLKIYDALIASGYSLEDSNLMKSSLEQHPRLVAARFGIRLETSIHSELLAGFFQSMSRLSNFTDVLSEDDCVTLMESSPKNASSYLAFDVAKDCKDISMFDDAQALHVFQTYPLGSCITYLGSKLPPAIALKERLIQQIPPLLSMASEQLKTSPFLPVAQLLASTTISGIPTDVTLAFQKKDLLAFDHTPSGTPYIVDSRSGAGNYLCSHTGTLIAQYCDSHRIEGGGFIHCPFTDDMYGPTSTFESDYTDVMNRIVTRYVETIPPGSSKTLLLTCFPRFGDLPINPTAQFLCREGMVIETATYGIKVNDTTESRCTEIAHSLGGADITPFMHNDTQVGYTLRLGSKTLTIIIAKLPVDDDLSADSSASNPPGDGAQTILSSIVDTYNPHYIVGLGVYPDADKRYLRRGVESRSFTVETIFTRLYPKQGKVQYNTPQHFYHNTSLAQLLTNTKKN